MTANVELARADLADKTRELEEISDRLVNTNDKLHAERRAAVHEANRWHDSYKSKKKELVAANQRIKELITSASLVAPTATLTERSTTSPTETPFLGVAEWMSC